MLSHSATGPPPTPLPLPVQTVGTGNHGDDQGDDAVSPVTVLPLLESTSPVSPRRHTKHAYKRLGKYILLGTLGEGEFGKVKLGQHVDTHQKVAVKLITKANVHSSSRMEKIQREIAVLKSLRHPNIVKLLDVIENRKYIGIILEYAPGGELYEYILAHSILTEEKASHLFAQLVSSVRYMHAKRTVHRDLKLENLLLDEHYESILVTDFGFANQFHRDGNDLMSTSCGSPCYAAPELVMNTDGAYHGAAADIWSCGVILYAMLCGYLPYDDDPENPEGQHVGRLYNYIMTTPLVFREPLSPEARDLTTRMLQPNPKQRCSFDEIVEHPWLQQHRALFEKAHQDDEQEAEQVVQRLRSPKRSGTSTEEDGDHASVLTTHSPLSHRPLNDGKQRELGEDDQASVISSDSSSDMSERDHSSTSSDGSDGIHPFLQEEKAVADNSTEKAEEEVSDRRASVYAVARPTLVPLPTPSTSANKRLSRLGKFSFGRPEPAKSTNEPRPAASLRRKRRHTHLLRLFTNHTKQRSPDETPTLTVQPPAPTSEALPPKTTRPRTRLFSTLRVTDRPKSMQLQSSLRAYFQSKEGAASPSPSPSPSYRPLSTAEKKMQYSEDTHPSLVPPPSPGQSATPDMAQKPPVGNRVMAWIKRRSHVTTGKHVPLQTSPSCQRHSLASRASSPAPLAHDDEHRLITHPHAPAALYQQLLAITATLGLDTVAKGEDRLECVRPAATASDDRLSLARSNEAQRHFKLDDNDEDDRSVSMISSKTGGAAVATATATTTTAPPTASSISLGTASLLTADPVYGHPAKDPGHQIRLAVDIHSSDEGQSTLTFTRLSGDAWTFAFLRRKILLFLQLHDPSHTDLNVTCN